MTPTLLILEIQQVIDSRLCFIYSRQLGIMAFGHRKYDV